ncbi:MAG: hypothetical protein A2X46_06755 [Lentisphaerae bacterium GWF2_57_35]|nr:MAG: hypothetical protein A2X46_06755 [Lentisphaerae bacterium GWF2_57_35]
MRSRRNILVTLLRIALGAGLLVLLFSQAHPANIREVFHVTTAHWPWLLLGTLLTLAGLCAGAIRWKTILAAQGIRLGAWKVFEVFFIGQFFNAFMLGACGGDVARAYLVMRETNSRKTETAATVFLDRAVGLFVVIAFCCVMIVFRIPLFLDHQGTRGPGLLMILFLVLAVLGFFALFRRNRFEHWSFFQYIETTRLGPLIRKAYDTFYLYRQNHRHMGMTFALSLLNLAFLTLACWAFGKSLLIPAGLIDYFTLFPIITVMAAVPLTPGSLGVREGFFVTLFQALGVGSSQSILLSLLVYAAGTVWSLAGGIVFLIWTVREGRPVTEEIRAVKNSL